MTSGGASFVSVVEAADFWKRDHLAVGDHVHGSRRRRVFRQREMSPRAVIVANVSGERASEVCLVEDDLDAKSLVADTERDDGRVARGWVFYEVAMTVGGVAFNVLWWYGAYVGKLTATALTARERRAHTIAWAPAPFVIAALTAVAFVNPALAVVGYVAAVAVYILPAPGLVALMQRHL